MVGSAIAELCHEEDRGTFWPTIYKKPARKSNPSKKVGEYIDFEEID
jgi:hypothetical protein